MKRRNHWLMLAAFTASCAAPTQPTSYGQPRGDYRKGELVVVFNPDVTSTAQDALLARYSLTRLQGAGTPRQLVAVPQGQELTLAATLHAEAGVKIAEPDFVKTTQEVKGSFRPLSTPVQRSLMMVPNDPYWNNAAGQAVASPLSTLDAIWGQRAIKADVAWDTASGSPDVLVATIDTGADMNHPDLVGNLDQTDALNLVEVGNPVDDDYGHGTHVAGIIGAVGNNGIGVIGVAWKTKVVPIRVLGVDGSGTSYDTVTAIDYAVSKGARVINMSLGSPDHSDDEDQAIQDAVTAGVVVVAASGNEAVDGNYEEYPASYANVVSVGAVGADLKRALFSNYNSHVSVVAPGVDILSTIPTRFNPAAPYGYLSGTSMATPMVTGVAALIVGVHPTWTVKQIVQDLENTAHRLAPAGDSTTAYNIFFGDGLVDASQAVVH